MITVKELKLVYSEDQLHRRVRELGEEISRAYRGQEPVCVCVLKGAVLFFADLIRNIDNVGLSIDFLQAASYGAGVDSGAEVRIVKDLERDVRGRQVLLIEDVIDTGLTMSRLIPELRGRGAADVRLCALIDKRERRECEVKIDYAGFVLPRGFIVGYGLDLDGKYRQLGAIYEAVIER